jgi:hypothetical protein
LEMRHRFDILINRRTSTQNHNGRVVAFRVFLECINRFKRHFPCICFDSNGTSDICVTFVKDMSEIVLDTTGCVIIDDRVYFTKFNDVEVGWWRRTFNTILDWCLWTFLIDERLTKVPFDNYKVVAPLVLI